jgi:predicted GNAT family acetyltransferase
MTGSRVLRAALALGLTGALSLAALANAAEITRDSYRAAVEPICRANTKANERILAGIRPEVRAGKLKPAATQFARAATALKRTLGELKAVPQPSADGARLARWLTYATAEAQLFEAAAVDLRAGKKGAAEHMVARLTETADRANAEVLPFEFHYCHFEPSRFT